MLRTGAHIQRERERQNKPQGRVQHMPTAASTLTRACLPFTFFCDVGTACHSPPLFSGDADHCYATLRCRTDSTFSFPLAYLDVRHARYSSAGALRLRGRCHNPLLRLAHVMRRWGRSLSRLLFGAIAREAGTQALRVTTQTVHCIPRGHTPFSHAKRNRKKGTKNETCVARTRRQLSCGTHRH